MNQIFKVACRMRQESVCTEFGESALSFVIRLQTSGLETTRKSRTTTENDTSSEAKFVEN